MGMSPTGQESIHQILQSATQPEFFGPAERQQRGQHTADRDQNKRHGEISNRGIGVVERENTGPNTGPG